MTLRNHMENTIKEIRKLAKKFDTAFKKRKIDVQSEEYEIGIIRYLIKDIFSPIISETEIPEMLFNPEYKELREERIREYVESLDDEDFKSAVRTVFTNLTEVPLRLKIISYIALFCEEGLEAGFFEADKTRIFGPEVETIGLEDKFFGKGSRKGFRGSGGGP